MHMPEIWVLGCYGPCMMIAYMILTIICMMLIKKLKEVDWVQPGHFGRIE